MNNHVSIIRRGIAYIVDLYLGTLLSTLPISIATMMTVGSISQNIFLLDKLVAIFAILLSLLLLMLYYIGIPVYFMKGQTLGKRLMDIKIIYPQISSLAKRQIIFMITLTSFGAMLGQLFTLLSGYNIIEIMNDITLSLSFITIMMFIFHKQHIALHDKIAKTEIKNIQVKFIKNKI